MNREPREYRSRSGLRIAFRIERWLVSAILFVPAMQTVGATEAPSVRLNTIGYLPDSPKRATVAAPSTGFVVVRTVDEAVVFKGQISGPLTNADTREQLWLADFTPLREEGTYRLDLPGIGRSAPFRIAPDVYREAFRTVTRGMYLWRCGTAVRGTYRTNTFTHAACHTNDASLEFVEGEPARKNGAGGWHDAGDYNKYVVNAGVTVGAMLRAWEDFGDAIQRMVLDLPESGDSLPDFLAELKWELDWLLTMQAPDGSVYHKLSTRDFGDFVLPEAERLPRYFSPWSSAATADFVAMTAAAARTFQPFDPDYAERCLQAAQRSYAFLQAHPENHRADLGRFTTGAYQTDDADDRLWAAVELWQSTGEPAVLRDVEDRVRRRGARLDVDFDWHTVGNLGLITYAHSTRPGRDERLVRSICSNLVATADEIVVTGARHGYERPLGTRYYWGCNGGVARQVILLQAAFRLSPKPGYRAAALDALNHLFGRNVYGRSMVTGLGHAPPMHPHDRRSRADAVVDPWPGYLVGGPHRGALSWEDDEENYRCNEIAINWNTALIYALAAFLDDAAWENGTTSSF